MNLIKAYLIVLAVFVRILAFQQANAVATLPATDYQQMYVISDDLVSINYLLELAP